MQGYFRQATNPLPSWATYIILHSHEPGDGDKDLSQDELEGQVVGANEASEPLQHGVDERHKRDDGNQVGADIRHLVDNIQC